MIVSILLRPPTWAAILSGSVEFILEEIKLIASEEINGAKNYIDFPGAILEVKESYFIVKTLDNYIKIIKWQTGAKLKIGERLSWQ